MGIVLYSYPATRVFAHRRMVARSKAILWAPCAATAPRSSLLTSHRRSRLMILMLSLALCATPSVTSVISAGLRIMPARLYPSPLPALNPTTSTPCLWRRRKSSRRAAHPISPVRRTTGALPVWASLTWSSFSKSSGRCPKLSLPWNTEAALWARNPAACILMT